MPIFNAATLKLPAGGGAPVYSLLLSDGLWRLATVQLRRPDNRCSAPATVCFDTVLLSVMAAHILTSWDQDAV